MNKSILDERVQLDQGKGTATVVLDGDNLTIQDVVNVARNNYKVEICEASRKKIIEIRKHIDENWITDDAPPVYGFNTGVGKLKDYNISAEDNNRFQKNIVMSHCGGVGEPASEEVVRATMVVRLNAFCQGVSGLRMETVERLVDLLNKGVHPVIPVQGSVGACGDLAPLAHMTSVMIGYEDAEAYFEGERMSAPEALEKAGLAKEFELKAKDCLALINGTTMFAGMAALNVADAEEQLATAEISAALSLEAVRGELAAFDERIHLVRKQDGQIKVAENIRRLVEGSKRTTEEARKVHLKDDVLHPNYQPRVQDLYSLRCLAQVQGACRDNFDYAKGLIEKEINAATDNPLVFWNEETQNLDFISGGNFHGEPIAFAMDIISMSLAEIGNISERRIFSLCDNTLSYGLPPMLVGEPVGLNCGYPVISCAAAALASENKTLCFPASVDTIPTKSNQEDHVSMAPWACRKLQQIIGNLNRILGIEFLLAARGIYITEKHLGQFELGRGTKAAYDLLRERIPFTNDDSYMPNQSKAAIESVEDKSILNEVVREVGAF
ncbi:histidine ammonia-lyase [Dethiosulfatibacter aminovorans DSM 17477]|uniref:Histidine ammonia-lyase n=1 Tax=Dethiosulfatibacter aminovorans DSM 17477 TaxID=1121476 RepID=A0A1M6H1R2_9FIRM|nr:histidine ammonia-lyase [Dethiosulfatibacter aminovorans]SHJ16148.1 histidine ammonia-lyase [Dethiosulfatibacter aminovorans DSM 17477]